MSQSHVSNTTPQQQFFVTCQWHQVENVTNIPNTGSQVFSMVKIFGLETTQKHSKILTIFTWLPPTVTDAFKQSRHEQNPLLPHA